MKSPFHIAMIRVWIIVLVCSYSGKGLGNVQIPEKPMLDQENVLQNPQHTDISKVEKNYRLQTGVFTELRTRSQNDSFPEEGSPRSSKRSLTFENTDADREFFEDSDGIVMTKPPLDVEKCGGSKHGDYFQCLPCKCSRTNRGCPIAHCASLNLTGFPLSLPKDACFINATGNRLRDFNTSDLIFYPNITTLDLSNNELVKIFGDESNQVSSKLETLILDHNNISKIADGSFRSMRKLMNLALRYNRIEVVNSTTFQGLEGLKHLYLSSNQIKDIQNTGLSFSKKLRELFLNNNKLNYDIFRKLVPVGNLTLLRRLSIQDNSHSCNSYPNEFLSNLYNLEELSIDGLGSGAEFGPELKSLKRLKTLSFGPNLRSRLKNITSTFFRNVPYLESLTFDHCLIRHIDPAAFYLIPQLQNYSLIGETHYDLDKAFAGLVGLENSSLKHVAFVHLYHTTPMCRTLSRDQGKYIEKLSLEELNLSDNRLALLGNDFIECIPITLKRLNLAGNVFPMRGNFWNRFTRLKNLKYLDVRNQNRDSHWLEPNIASQIRLSRSLFRSQESHLQGRGPLLDQTKYSWPISHNYENEHRSMKNIFKFPHSPESSDIPIKRTFHIYKELRQPRRTKLRLPPKLTTVRASEYMYFGYVPLFHKLVQPNNLLHLNFASSFLNHWGAGVLPVSVETLNLSDNNCRVLSRYFFPRGNHLITLDVKRNFLGDVFYSDESGNLFQNLKNLDYLDISINSIFTLPVNFFRGLVKLRTLIMSNNKLNIFKMNISHMRDLQYLDLSKNSISWIEETVRQQLDEIGSRHTLKLDLTKNPLPCTCRGIELLEWMANTNVCILSEEYLSCYNDEGKPESNFSLKVKLKQLKHQCASYTTIITGAAGGGAFLLSISLAIALYKGRWHIMYSFNNGFLTKLFGFKPRGRKASTRFDAFVVYEEEDRDFVLEELLPQLETKRGHVLCLEDRDFIPGTLNFNNIVNAVQNSQIVLFVISPDFVKAKEFEYPIHMALIEEYNSKEKREVCKLLIYKPTPTKNMSRELQMLLMKGRFVEYPLNTNEGCSSQDMLNNFWNRLSNELGHTTHTHTIITTFANESDTQPLLS